MKQKFKAFLKTGNPWEKMETDIPSVSIVKVPGPKKNPIDGARLMIEINPVDESGKPKKRKGLFVADREMYHQFLEALQDDRINKILFAIEDINPTKNLEKK